MLTHSILNSISAPQPGTPQPVSGTGKGAQTPFAQLIENISDQMRPADVMPGVMPGVISQEDILAAEGSIKHEDVIEAISNAMIELATPDAPVTDKAVSLSTEDIQLIRDALARRADSQPDNMQIRLNQIDDHASSEVAEKPVIDPMIRQADSLPETTKAVRPAVVQSPLTQSIMQSIHYAQSIRDAGDKPVSQGALKDRLVEVGAIVKPESAPAPVQTEQLTSMVKRIDNAMAADPKGKSQTAPFTVTADTTATSQSLDGSRIITGSGSLQTNTAAAQLASPVGTDQWGKELGRQLIQMTRSGPQQIELRLNPVELGPLSISLKMNDASQAQAQFLSHNPLVRQALESALPQLRDALSDQGITLSQSDVRDSAAHSFARHEGEQQNNQQATKQAFDVDVNVEVDQVIEGIPPSHDGLISTYA